MGEQKEPVADKTGSADEHGTPVPGIIQDAPSDDESSSDERESDPSIGARLSQGGRSLGESSDELKIVDSEPPSGEFDEVILTPADSGFHQAQKTPIPKPSMMLTPGTFGDDFDGDQAGGSKTPRAAHGAESTLSPDQLHELETLVSMGNWQKIREMVGSPEAATKLPATMQIVYGVACKENAVPGEPTSDTDAMTISAMATLLGVKQDSPLALVLAKRALRSKRPWGKREAPRGPLTFIILLLGLSLGGLVGWWATYMM